MMSNELYWEDAKDKKDLYLHTKRMYDKVYAELEQVSEERQQLAVENGMLLEALVHASSEAAVEVIQNLLGDGVPAERAVEAARLILRG